MNPTMSDCFERLPLWARIKLFVPPGHKDWKQCNSCNVYKSMTALKKCAACSEFRLRAIYYCASSPFSYYGSLARHLSIFSCFTEQGVSTTGLAKAQSRLQDIQRAKNEFPGHALFWHDQGTNGLYEGARRMGVCELSDGGVFNRST
jgi:hypothetical protein